MTLATWLLMGVSLVGSYFNVRRRIECFYFWSVANTGWVYVDFKTGQYAQGCLFVVFLLFSLYGIWIWRKDRMMRS